MTPVPIIITGYTEQCLRASMGVLGELLDHAAIHGYRRVQTTSDSIPKGDWAGLKFYLEWVEDPAYWFEVGTVAHRLTHFGSERSSHRGSIRVGKPTFEAFLEEMNTRRAEWVRKGRVVSRDWPIKRL